MIDNDIIDKTFPGGRAGFMEQHVMETDGIQIESHTGLGPCRKLPRPVSLRFCRNRGFYADQVFFGELLAERDKQILLGGEVQVECSLGNIGARGDLVDGRGSDPLFEKQALSGVHQLIAPFLRRFGPWTKLLFHSSRSTLRSVGNSFIHNSATAIVPTPPSTAAGIAPNKAAVTPLSN